MMYFQIEKKKTKKNEKKKEKMLISCCANAVAFEMATTIEMNETSMTNEKTKKIGKKKREKE
jgi:putative lipase involved disintegration of autophagic bodies